MRTKEENFVNMARATNAVLQRYKDEWQGAKSFSDNAKLLKEFLESTAGMSTKAKLVSTGVTEDKEQAGEIAIDLAVKLAKRASVYALDNRNNELHDQLDVTASSISRLQDNQVVAKLRDIEQRLLILVPALADYNVTEALVLQLKEWTDKYEVMTSRPREVISERKTYNDALPLLVDNMRQVFTKLDNLINIFDQTQLEAEYWNARKIIDLGSRKEKDDEGGTPMTA